MTATKHLIVLAGPTAVGKTSISIQLAKQFHSEIISCDSRQLYKEMHIGVAKPSAKELAAVQHHFIDHCSIQDPYNAGTYQKECRLLLDRLFQKRDVLFMVGGTGLYIKAATEGLDALPEANKELRASLQKLMDERGIDALQRKLKALDPSYQIKDDQNPQRLIRAIEIATATPTEHDLPSPEPNIPYETHLLYLDRERSALYKRINQRVDQMISEGLVEEARTLYTYRNLNALQTVGYKELFNYFDQKCALEEAIEKIKQHSRNYAKRQITWFKNQGFTAVPADAEAIQGMLRDLLK